MKKKRIVRLFTMFCVLTLLAAFMAIPASAAASNVSGAIEGTWNAAKGQVQTIVNNVVFPVIDMILAVLLFVKIATAYMDYRKHGQFEFTAPAILFAYPRFSGDKALVSGFMKNGYSAELARRRIALGCNWMSLPGLEYTMNDLVKINMAKVFEVAFQEYQGDDLAEFYDVFRKDLLEAIACIKAGIDFHLKNQYRNAPELLLNLVSHGPIEKGRDASHGGLQYYNIAIDGAGIATVADSFAALELHCCEKKDLSWDQVRNAIAVNFEGPEADAVRRILKNTPMYGYGGTEADGWALRISRFFTERISQERTPEGHLTIPGLFSWANTVPFGKQVGATPNGRRAGEPINHGANPNNGFRKDGAFTAAAKAIAAVQPGYGNTAPFQLELNDTIIDRENAIENVAAVLKGHFDMGGTLVNVNIVDKDQILAANEDPSAYPNLIVRVTGFTAYFSALSPEFRQLVVDRIISL